MSRRFLMSVIRRLAFLCAATLLSCLVVVVGPEAMPGWIVVVLGLFVVALVHQVSKDSIGAHWMEQEEAAKVAAARATFLERPTQPPVEVSRVEPPVT
jgi:hypothetical protein